MKNNPNHLLTKNIKYCIYLHVISPVWNHEHVNYWNINLKSQWATSSRAKYLRSNEFGGHKSLGILLDS